MLLVPGQSPYFIERAEGPRFWDVDGNEYIDYMCAYGPMILGYNHPTVEKAARNQSERGNCFNLPSSLWVELAEYLVDLIPTAAWSVFGKNGSDAINYACQVARAYTEKAKIIMAQGAYHGIGAWCSPSSFGITDEDKANVLTFTYNDVENLKTLLESNRDDIAGIIVTPFRHDVFHDLEMPIEPFLKFLKECTGADGPLLIIDDIRAGFRLHMGGSGEYFGLKPQLSCFSKAMGNGHPISACVGSDAIMEAAGKVFFTGSFFTSAVPMAAALATLHEMAESNAIEHIFRIGEKLREGILNQAESLGLDIHYTGPVTIPFMTFVDDPSFEKIRTFCACAFQEGVFFHPYHNWFLSAAHGEAEIEETLQATQKAFEEVKEKHG
jgi:glutamate-1-semialdehyde 2,1-aminomutase